MLLKQNLKEAVLLISFIGLLVSGCAHVPPKDKNPDGPPLVYRDVSNVPNAYPKVEPFTKSGNPASYMVFGKKYHVMKTNQNYTAKGTASWYGRKFHGRKTSSGEVYDMFAMTAAHKTLPLPTYAKVKNLSNGKEIIVKINDRGPFVEDRLIDLSYAAAKKLGVYETGTAKVQIVAIDPKKFNTTKHQPTAHVLAAQDRLVLPKAHSGKPLYLQLGAFKDKENAYDLAQKAMQLTHSKEGIKISVISPQKGSKWYKVRVGPLPNLNAIESLKGDLAELSTSLFSVVVD